MALRGTTYTLAQVRADVRIRMDDPSDVRWTEAQKNLAINAAVRHARGMWWEERIDDSNTYDEDIFRYTLPPGCESVQAVFLEPTAADNPRYFVVPTHYHIEGNELVFEKYGLSSYDGQTMYIIYLVYQANLLEITYATGAVISDYENVLVSTDGLFHDKGVQEGDAVIISGDATYYVVSVNTNNTEITLHKDATVGTNLTYFVAYYTDLPYEYLIYGSMAELYEMSSRNRPGVEVEENIRWATYYRQLADRELRSKTRHPRPYRRY